MKLNLPPTPDEWREALELIRGLAEGLCYVSWANEFLERQAKKTAEGNDI